MYNSEKTANRQNKWVSLLICWLIILGGYLLIRMVFLIFGLQLHLAAQGACLVLLPFIFGALYLRKCCKKQKTWFYVLGLLLPAVAEKLTLYFLGAYLCGISPLRVTAVMEAIGRTEPYAVLITRMPMRYVINLLFFNLIYSLCRSLCIWLIHFAKTRDRLNPTPFFFRKAPQGLASKPYTGKSYAGYKPRYGRDVSGSG